MLISSQPQSAVSEEISNETSLAEHKKSKASLLPELRNVRQRRKTLKTVDLNVSLSQTKNNKFMFAYTTDLQHRNTILTLHPPLLPELACGGNGTHCGTGNGKYVTCN
jgi:hypothetical protein